MDRKNFKIDSVVCQKNILSILILLIVNTILIAQDQILHPNELDNKILESGTTVFIKNGHYKNVIVTIRGTGYEEAPIYVKAETPGKVIFSENSRIVIEGDYLFVSDLYFKGTEGKFMEENNHPVIRFLGSNCSFSNSIIDGYNYNPGYWIEFKNGKYNRLDHCHFFNKKTEAPVIQVWTGDTPNYHIIDHNYFGYREELGRNGAEIIRIGFSHEMDNISRTIVEKNLFEDFQGEIEIISNKSCENIFRNNTFRRCTGQLTLRHGDRCVIESNFFIGEMSASTRGIRIIGSDNIVINNYFESLTEASVVFQHGKEYREEQVRYNPQTKNTVIAYNHFINLPNAVFNTVTQNKELGYVLEPTDISIVQNNFINKEDSIFIFSPKTVISKLNFKGNYISYPYANHSELLIDSVTNILANNDIITTIFSLEKLKKRVLSDSLLFQWRDLMFYLFPEEGVQLSADAEMVIAHIKGSINYTSPLEISDVGSTIGPVWIRDSTFGGHAVIKNIYPNPLTDKCYIDIHLMKESDFKILVFSIEGRLCDTIFDQKLSAGNHLLTWQPKNLANQLYVVIVSIDDNIVSQEKIQIIK